MLHRNSQPTFIKWIKKGAAVLFVAEAASFAGSYLLWYRMNTNRDFRQYMSTSFPSILDKYYSLGEYMNGSGPVSSLRTIDAEYWRHEPKPSTGANQ